MGTPEEEPFVSILKANDNINIEENVKSVKIENENEKKQRRNSRFIVYFSSWLSSLGYSIIIVSAFPYLIQLETELNKENEETHFKELLGWIIAANCFGQIISSPLIGWWCNYLQSVRLPVIVSLFLYIFGNVWYGLLNLHSSNRTTFMFISRFIVGLSAGSNTAFMTYFSKETLLSERTTAFSHLALFQALGFILGPVVSIALTPIGKIGFNLIGDINFTSLNGPGYISALFGILNLFLFYPKFFIETNISEREISANINKDSKEKIGKLNNPHYSMIALVAIGFFVVLFDFTIIETLGVPLSIDQFSWSETKAMINVGLVLSISSIFTTSLFAVIGPICKRFDERIVLLALGFVPMLLGRIFFFPYGTKVANMRTYGCLNSTNINNADDEFAVHFNVTGTEELMSYNKTECKLRNLEWDVIENGCPQEQTWCFQIPALTPLLIMVGYCFFIIGIPFSVALLQSFYSKLIGPRPQGLWMGGLTMLTSLARAVAPIFITYFYTYYGTIVTNSINLVITFLTTIIFIATFKKLVPFPVEQNK